MKEIWKPVVGYEGLYEVSNLGRVKTLPKTHVFKNGGVYNYPEKIMSACLNSNGYPQLKLFRNGVRKVTAVHRLVAAAFIPNPENKTDVNHIDGVKTNNTVTNLEWATKLENSLHAKVNGLMCRLKGSTNPMAKISESDVLSIIEERKNIKTSHKELANKYGVGTATISNICRNTSWKHIKRDKI